ncbi:hypothetical protein FRZ06_11950 [Anoxybacterium hadale]|uniref:Uncharacterized protein n=1 Tax=Anoxybacterium hadale TaxID=3408580 RepID=A0ACD1ABW9_9FIRM|nr:hypothetical protein FRZ06_11950 [Clostridiales bacterium]
MSFDMFSWQEKDFKNLCDETKERIQFIKGKDLQSPYHIFNTFQEYLQESGVIKFVIAKPNLDIVSPLLPFVEAIIEDRLKKPSDHKLAQSIVKDITKSETLASIVADVSTKLSGNSLILTERGNDLMVRLEKAASQSPSTFLFYGYPIYDSFSKELVHLLLSGKLDNDFPFLEKTTYYFLCDSDENSDLYADVLRYNHIDLEFKNPDAADMNEIINEIIPELALQPLDTEKLYRISGGRLSVIEILARHLNFNHLETSQSVAPDKLINMTLDCRFANMGMTGNLLKDTLKIAAAIGSSFSIPLLKEVLDSKANCDMLLKRSKEEFLTKGDTAYGEFYYREIWGYFYNYGLKENFQEISSAIAEAIYCFSPHDYLARAYHLENAGQLMLACELYIYSYNTVIQEGFKHSEELAAKINSLACKCGLESYWNALTSYYASIEKLDYANAFDILEYSPAPPTIRLLLLKEYLLSLSMYRFGETYEQQQSALVTLEQVTARAKEIEEGFWCDCMTILLTFYINLNGDLRQAQIINKELTYYYTEKGYSPFAKKGIHALERKWNAIFSVERAVYKTQSSVDFFRDSVFSSQYIMALNNHAANLMVLYRLDEAQKFLVEALDFIHTYKNIAVNKIYILNNFFVCKVLNRGVTPREAYEKLYHEFSCFSSGDWKFIVEMNCAIFLALEGELFNSLDILTRLEEECNLLKDDYFLYYLRANIAAIQYLLGNTKKAVDLMRNSCMTPPLLCKESEKKYLYQRTDFWIHIMESENITDPLEFDEYLLRNSTEKDQPLEKRWGFIGRGFLYSDIQFWSEP